MRRILGALLALTIAAQAPAQVQTQGLPARFIATFPGTGVESSAVLGQIIRTVTKSGGTVTFTGQAEDESPATFTLDREIFVPSPTTALVSPTAAMFEAGRVTFWNGNVYRVARNVDHEATGLVVTWTPYADDLFLGTVDSFFDVPACTAVNVGYFYFIRGQLRGFYECVRIGTTSAHNWEASAPTNYGLQTAQYIGRFATEAGATSHATAPFDIAYWYDDNSVPQIVTAFSLPTATEFSYYWDHLIDVAGWALSGEETLIPRGKLVFGTPSDGQVVTWSDANSRLQWANAAAGGSGNIQDGTGPNQLATWNQATSQWIPQTLAVLLGAASWAWDAADEQITVSGDPVIAATVIGQAALAGGVQTALDNISAGTGNDGWSPLLAITTDGERRVLRLAGWTGGEGSQPGMVGQFLGPSGLVSAVADAVDIRGATGPAGTAGAGAFRGLYSTTATYVRGDTVYFQTGTYNEFWIAVNGTQASATHPHYATDSGWSLVTSRGEYRGVASDDSAFYRGGHIARANSNLYLYVGTSGDFTRTTITTSSDWQILTALAFSQLTGQIAAAQIPDDAIQRRMVATDTITKDELHWNGSEPGLLKLTIADEFISVDQLQTDDIQNEVVTREKLSLAVRNQLDDGDITGVTAGSGLTGGGNTGTVALAVAADGITNAHVADDAIQTANVLDGAITIPKLAQDVENRLNAFVNLASVNFQIAAHNTSTSAHADLRELAYYGNWSSTVNYVRGATVSHSGALWQAETNPAVDDEPRLYASAVWRQISNSVQWRGDSSSLTSYTSGDIVRHNSEIYLYGGTSPTTNPPPSDGWVSLTAAGSGGGASSFDDLTGTINDTQIPDDRITARMVADNTIDSARLTEIFRQEHGTYLKTVTVDTNIFTGNGTSGSGISFIAGAIQTPHYRDASITEVKLAQAVRNQLGVEGPEGPEGPQGPAGNVVTVLGEGDGMVRTNIITDHALTQATIVAEDAFANIPVLVTTINQYDWIEVYARQSSELWSGRIRVNEDAANNIGDASIGGAVSAAIAGAHPVLYGGNRERLVFATSDQAANTQLYWGSPDVGLNSSMRLTIWGLSEGVIPGNAHELTEGEATDSTSTAFGLISGQRLQQASRADLPTVSQADATAGTATDRRAWTAERVRQGASAAIDTRIIRVDHTPPVATAANASSVVLVGNTGDAFVQRQETHHGTAATATWQNYIDTASLGAFGNPPTPQVNRTYFNTGLRIWFRAISYAGQLRWVSGGEPDAWRGYAPSENVAAANNVDAVDDVVYIANLFRLRQVVTFTPGTNTAVSRTWENQRDSDWEGAATATERFYRAGEFATVVDTGDTIAYLCNTAGDYSLSTIPSSTGWTRVTPPILTRIQTSDANPLDDYDLTFTNQRIWHDTNFVFTAAMLASTRLEVTVISASMLFNRTFHPSHFESLTAGTGGQDVDIDSTLTPPAPVPDGRTPTAMPMAAADGDSGTDLRIWLGRDSDNSLLVAIRPGSSSRALIDNVLRVRAWYHK